MKMVFVSNYYNHHQSALSHAMYASLQDNYCFVSTQPMREERRKLGYDQIEEPDYVIRAYISEENRAKAREWIASADVVIAGSAPETYFRERIRAGKLIFRYMERPLKQKISPWMWLYMGLKWHIKNPVGKPIYLLCASAFTAGDFLQFGLFKKSSYQWGYFPATETTEDLNAHLAEKKKTMILWCGRLLGWKHPEDAIEVARRLKENGHQFEMVLVGTGELEQQLRQRIDELDLQEFVQMVGAVPPQQVRCYMRKAGIYLFTSDRREGWGAVLNESMNSGCAVIASHIIGAAPYLIKDDCNGCIYRSGDVDMLYEKVSKLLTAPEKQYELGKNAYNTITQLWDADVAAERLLALSASILSGNRYPDLFADGPCAKASPVEDDWY